MGAVSAFYGLQKCMSILHGSQGCSTYIRRHMATHYNEPVDIASSSLTEEGTVFGGEKNLVKGLDNLIRLYQPEVIGISTTCLAETIGEDVPAIIKRYYANHPELSLEGSKVKIFIVASPGYAGTQYEGWFRALHAIVSQTEMQTKKHPGINIITGPISPADTRALKTLLDSTGINYVLLPDISRNLDGGHASIYQRLPSAGTKLEQVACMAGARATLELAGFAPAGSSPGKFLEESYGVPLVRLAMPVGLRDTDAFIQALQSLGAAMPIAVHEERERCLDAMIDAHKHSALGRAAIFGEPDLVYGLTRLCCENGLVPVVAATGSNCPGLKDSLEAEISEAAAAAVVPHYSILNFADFDDIERASLLNGANLLIGSSDGRRIEEKRHIPLVRCAFPVHDHLGGQRIRLLGYSGAVNMLERFANVLISSVEGSFRADLRNLYYQPAATVPNVYVSSVPDVYVPSMQSAPLPSVAEKTETHPCFSCSACNTHARLHLPVAPKCNISCNYCVRRFDCVNESRPGVTTKVLSPEEALARYVQVKSEMGNLSVVGIAGPGDALANFEESSATLSLIRELDPSVTFCLSTNGLLLPLYADRLVELGVSHVTVTINAVDPAIGAKIYRRVNYLGIDYSGEAGAAILLANQLAGLKYLAERGVVCKVNIVLLKGINDAHVEEVVSTVKKLGAYITNIMQMIPVKGSVFENMPLTSNVEHMALRKTCETTLRQMYHCKQCRADAVGLLGDDQSIRFRDDALLAPITPPFAEEAARVAKPIKIAVASKSGVLVDQHFGNAELFYIYESDGLKSRLVETRSTRSPGEAGSVCDARCGGKPGKVDNGKITRAIDAVADCRGVLALRIGDLPSQKLKERGISAFSTYENIDKAVKEAALSLCG
jgi:nitrogenase molybdenum-iron protein alpha/beta subunit/MoaA/NifB/PqqE/SkfB family radical SAM enzyme